MTDWGSSNHGVYATTRSWLEDERDDDAADRGDDYRQARKDHA